MRAVYNSPFMTPTAEMIEQLAAEEAQARRNGVWFAAGVIMLTPILVLGALFGIFVFFLSGVLPDLLELLKPPVVIGIVFFFFVLMAAVAWEQDRKRNYTAKDIPERVGAAMVLPGALLEAYLILLTCSWPWWRLTDTELKDAACLLCALEEKEWETVNGILRGASRKASKRMVHALESLQFIRRDGAQLFLTIEGREFLSDFK